MADDLIQLKRLQRLERKPGDVLVLSFQRPLSAAQHAAVRRHWEVVMGDAPLLILDAGATIGVVTPEPPRGD